jgi:hypothetical protein
MELAMGFWDFLGDTAAGGAGGSLTLSSLSFFLFSTPEQGLLLLVVSCNLMHDIPYQS